MGLGLDRAGGAARLIRAGLIAVSLVIAACTSPPIAPSASPSAIAIVSTPTPAPTASPSPTATHYTNAVLGFAVTLPASWRVSRCLSRFQITSAQTYFAQDVLTWHGVTEEQDLGISGGVGTNGAYAWVVVIRVEASPLSAAEYATVHVTASRFRVETDTIDGRPAARIVDPSGNALTYYVANGGRMYSVGLTNGSDPRPAQVSPPTFDGIAHSVTLLAELAVWPTPTPAPVLSAGVEALADAVAVAFAASDADRLRQLMTPVCWFNSGFNQSEGTAASPDKVAAGLRANFAQGLRVTVEPRPIMTTTPYMPPGSFWVWSTWSAYANSPQRSVALAFDQIDGRWYWTGALFNAPRP